MVARADLAVLPGVGSALRAEGSPPAGSTTRSESGSSRGATLGICLGSSSLSSRRTRTAASVGWAFCRDAPCGCEKGAFLGSDGRVDPGRRGVLLRTLVRRGDARRNRGSEGVVAVAEQELRRRPVPSGGKRPSRRPLPGAMPLPRLIPCLDVQAGASSRGPLPGAPRRRRPGRAGQAYSESGADELVFLDVAATVEGRDMLPGLVRRVAERLAIPFTVGGGVRTVGDARRCSEAGADKVSVNSGGWRPGS